MSLAVRRQSVTFESRSCPLRHFFPRFAKKGWPWKLSQLNFCRARIVFDLAHRRPMLSGKVWRLYGQQIR
jgi:hypothetical protein